MRWREQKQLCPLSLTFTAILLVSFPSAANSIVNRQGKAAAARKTTGTESIGLPLGETVKKLFEPLVGSASHHDDAKSTEKKAQQPAATEPSSPSIPAIPFSVLATALGGGAVTKVAAPEEGKVAPEEGKKNNSSSSTKTTMAKKKVSVDPEGPTAFLAFSEVEVVRRAVRESAAQSLQKAREARKLAEEATKEAEEVDHEDNGLHYHFKTTMEAPYLGAGPMREITAHPAAMVWLHYLTVGVVIKGLCMASNVFFQASPFPKVHKFHQEEDTGEADPAPYVAVAFGGAQWVFYGLFAWATTGTKGFLVVVYANVLGAILGLIYVIVYHRNCRNVAAASSLNLYFRIVAALVLFQAVVIVFLPRERALYISGLVSCMCSVAASASTLATLPTVLRTKSAESIPMEMAVVCMVSGLLWVTCGLMIGDVWLVIPNLVGFLCNVGCLGLVFVYGKGAPSKGVSSVAGSPSTLPLIPGESPQISVLQPAEEGSAAEAEEAFVERHEEEGHEKDDDAAAAQSPSRDESGHEEQEDDSSAGTGSTPCMGGTGESC